MKEQRLRAVLEEVAPGYVAFFIPADVVGTQAPAEVSGTIDGHAFAAETSPSGDGRLTVFVPEKMREATGLKAGDRVEVVLRPEAERREVAVPEDLRVALAEAAAGLDFEQLPWTERKRYVEWVEQAGEAEARRRRIEQAATMVRERKPAPAA